MKIHWLDLISDGEHGHSEITYKAFWHFKRRSSLTWSITTDEGVVEASEAEFKNLATIFDLVRIRSGVSEPFREIVIDPNACRQWFQDCYGPLGYQRCGCTRLLKRQMLEKLLLYAQNPHCSTLWFRARHLTLKLSDEHDKLKTQRAQLESTFTSHKLHHVMVTLDTLRSNIMKAVSVRHVPEVLSVWLKISRFANLKIGKHFTDSSTCEEELDRAKPFALLRSLESRSRLSSSEDADLFEDMALITRLRVVIQDKFRMCDDKFRAQRELPAQNSV